MSLFGRKKKDSIGSAFWRNCPVRTTDSDVLMYHGIECGQQDDGRGKLAAGWAIDLGNIGSPHAFDLIREGYEMWRESADYDRGQAHRFLLEMRDRLAHEPPAPYYYNPRCWAGIELLDVLNPEERAEAERALFDETREVDSMYLSFNEMQWGEEYAKEQGLPLPWT